VYCIKNRVGTSNNLQTTPQIKENKIFDFLRYGATTISNKGSRLYIVDQYIYTLAQKLVKHSPEAMCELKKVSWAGTENYNELLAERAGIRMSETTRLRIEDIQSDQGFIFIRGGKVKKTAELFFHHIY